MVTRTTEPSPGTRNSRVRPTGQRSPRSRSRYTPYRYSAADSSRTSARNGSSRPCDTSDTPVNGGRAVTLILVSSSVTCQIGVFAAERGDVFALRRWFTLTFILGLIFVLGQANEYRTLVSEGIKINADGYGSVFYLTTGFHGLHVTGG